MQDQEHLSTMAAQQFVTHRSGRTTSGQPQLSRVIAPRQSLSSGQEKKHENLLLLTALRVPIQKNIFFIFW